jgi:hypothetical protein
LVKCITNEVHLPILALLTVTTANSLWLLD